jgi:hypothetical protein
MSCAAQVYQASQSSGRTACEGARRAAGKGHAGGRARRRLHQWLGRISISVFSSLICGDCAPSLVGPQAIYICNGTVMDSSNYLPSNLLLLPLLPAARGHNPVDDDWRLGGITLSATTDRGYELRSRGPPSLGKEALDKKLHQSLAKPLIGH